MSVTDRAFLHEELLRGPVTALSAKVVTLAGCGALGSWTGLFLANSGVRNFRLIDRDRVEIHNTSTQFHDASSLGKSKVQSLGVELYRRHKCRVERHPFELSERNATTLLGGSDLIICTFDNQAARRDVQATALRLGIPTVMAGMHGAQYWVTVDWAENFIAPPDPREAGQDPCNYPLSASLCTYASSLIAETALRYLTKGERLRVKRSMMEAFT